jgi:peptidase E
MTAVGRLLLASRRIPHLAHLAAARGTRAMLIPTAANELAEPQIADEVEEELLRAGFAVGRLDLDAAEPDEVRATAARADVIAVSGGDPFHLLDAARRARFGQALRHALHDGTVYVGYRPGRPSWGRPSSR